MKSQSGLNSKYIILAASLFFMFTIVCQVSAQSIGWKSLPGTQSSVEPALSDHSDGKLYAATIDKTGRLLHAASDSPNGWTVWQQVGSGAPLFATNTAPVFIRDFNALFLFARGADSNLYVNYKVDANAWSTWQPLATGGQIAGRFSVAITRLNSSTNPELHVIFKSYGDTVKYMRFSFNVFNWVFTGTSKQWTSAQEGVIGTNGYEAMIAIRTTNAVVVESLSRLLLFSGPVWVFVPVTKRAAEGADGQVYELSNIAYLGEAFHVAYAIKYYNSTSTFSGYVFTLEHSRFRSGKSYDGYRRTITGWDSNGQPPQPELCVYRNKLVAAYRDHQSYIRYARWDNADSAEPWIGKEKVAGGLSDHRPALATFNRLNYWPVTGDHGTQEAIYFYSNANFGDDLFAAVNGINDDAIWVANFSRDIFRIEVGRQFGIFNAYIPNTYIPNLNTYIPGSCPVSLQTAYAVTLNADDRPLITELGYNQWILPNWLSGTIYKKIGVGACSSSDPYYKPPCTEAKLPVVIQCPQAGIFFNDYSSIWITMDSSADRIFEEIGHMMAGAIKLDDPGAIVDGAVIPKAPMLEAYDIFGVDASSSYKNSSGRYVGFTDVSHETEVQPSRQHHFIYPLSRYYSDGDTLRRWVQEDLSHGSNLLKRKYDWIKWNIYRGVEFKTNNEPLVTRPACTFTISPTNANIGNGPAGGNISVLTQEGCNWSATSKASWIGFTGSHSGTESGSIKWSVTSSNFTGIARTGTITIGNKTFTIRQDPWKPPSCPRCPLP